MKTLTPLFTAITLGTASTLAIVSATTAAAQDLTCGSTYTVASSDSLSGIAARVYGSAAAYQLIYSANADTIGSNPGLISAGMRLDIPCQDDGGASQANNAAIRLVETTQQLDAPETTTIRVVTATDWAPYFDESQEQGGMVTELTNVALASADGNPAYKIDFINDWGSHLQPLLTDHAYDFASAWYEPNCDLFDQLGDDAKFRCSNFAWTDPMFEILLGYFSRSDQPLPQTHAELAGLSICRPDGYETFVLEEDGLVEPIIEFGQEVLITGCMQGLLDGTYDVVVIAVDPGQGAILELGAQDDVMLNEQLTKVLNLSPVIAKSNPNFETLMASMNIGITKIKGDGRWFEIVNRHLSAHRSLTR